ncbi:MAG: thioredoxin [Sulfurimonas sp. RIFOXYD12_FULL_33_39]|uniref:thioredoxin family protein n=1 Tax=unclassified Sulfurimonas TaxID=2623549 RepID=UPI0008D621BD|nr:MULTISPECIES: thioredoxin family protein [unclassified Sulfurimonas]OHE06357.1 MAG: thioredoxin [Sulfurimonas sp. RIFCSPLOWO2_12_FULL_34_6]OHE08959.1 MAG: thioredoxin [Sulfurimonas sp. RIFOXYD12_FULL_33_39]OHE14269.1 MAG: thioredoxin [Sulfurimonas sp. RIFOXYD2_FULL_34_21]DAB28876.1 MAG TPA: thioredoxin [Sulfurimonas sp. UBA10385]
MKPFILLFVLLSFLYSAQIDEFANGVGYLRSYNMALESAKKEQKLIMLLVVSDYCPWCKKFERKVLENPLVKEAVNRDFIAVAIDKNSDKGNYPQEFAAVMIPAVYFIDPKTQKSIYEVVAYRKKDEYLLNLKEALEIFKQNDKL